MTQCKSVKRLWLAIWIVMAATLTLLLPLCVRAQEHIESIRIEYTLPNGFTYSLKPSVVQRADETADALKVNEYVFVLPYAVKERGVSVYPAPLTKDGKTVEQNDVLLEEGLYTMTVDGEEYSVNILYASDVPQLYITLGDGELEKVNADKEYRTSGQIVVTDGRTTDYDGALEYLTGRGNTSWEKGQKPYNIKFAAKTAPFGMDAAKKFSLIAASSDYSGIKNKIVFDLADAAGIKYTPQIQMVDVYIDGIYCGNYCFVERIEVAEGRVDIFNLDDLNEAFNPGVDLEQCEQGGDTKDKAWARAGSYKWIEIPNETAADLTGGFLLELDVGYRYDGEKAGFITIHGQPVVIKSPEYASQKQVEYIRDYYQQFEYALLNDNGYNSEGKHYSEYADMESMAKMFVLHEYVKDVDAGVSSFYMYKDLDGKLAAGPVWDKDNSLSGSSKRFGKDLSDPWEIWAGDIWRKDTTEWRNFLTMLWIHEDFRSLVAQQWDESFASEAYQLADDAQKLYEQLQNSIVATNYIYNDYGNNMQDIKSISESHANIAINFMRERSDFMAQHLGEDRCSVIYANNGGYGVTIDPNTYHIGDTVTVLKEEYILSGANFTGWNTQRDGGGEWYYPGDTVTVDRQSVVLYAQWDNGYMLPEYEHEQEEYENISILQYFINKIESIFKR